MERKDFLKSAGALGIASLIPFTKTKSAINAFSKAELIKRGGCVLIPSETAGPYVIDLSSNSAMFRQDITEGNPGIPLSLTLTVVNINNDCAPIPNARVDLWHCNHDGYYSGFDNQPGYLGTQDHAGETFFRGIQLTDVNGEVNFITIYPGWYIGRVTHMHFQVFINSVLGATSQLAFPEEITTEVYNNAVYGHGQSSITNATDGVFSDTNNTQYQIVSVAADGAGGYTGSLTIGIDAPTTGVINLEPETGGQFKLLKNYPNPFITSTTISFTLTNPSNVKIEIFDLAGRKIVDVINEKMTSGEQKVTLKKKIKGMTLSAGSYVYQLTVENKNGIFRQCKSLTVK